MSTALIVIDVQEEHFSGHLPIEFPPRESSLDRITTAIDRAAAASVPVVLVRHTGAPGERSFQQATLLHDAVGVPVMPDLDGTPVAAEILQRAALPPLALMGVDVASAADWIQTLAPGSHSDS
jgi:nicotinamidase-related amidase